MNNLNQILIEGNLVADPVATEKGCEMEIVSKRFFKGADGEIEKAENTFTIQARDLLAKKCLEHLKAGRGVRVIGRLDQEKVDGKVTRVFILADHVIFKAQGPLGELRV